MTTRLNWPRVVAILGVIFAATTVGTVGLVTGTVAAEVVWPGLSGLWAATLGFFFGDGRAAQVVARRFDEGG